VKQIGGLKQKRRRAVLDTSREEQVLRKQLPVARQLGLDPVFITQMFRAIFKLSRSIQRTGIPRKPR
jgi:chorismate mutase